METFVKYCLLILLINISTKSFSQVIVEKYDSLANDSLKIGPGEQDYMAYIQEGYTLMLPEEKTIRGVIILLEDSGFDGKNKNAKQIYGQAHKNNFAVLSVSTKIPLDFYFSDSSFYSAHNLIREAFSLHTLPNENIFFIGASLVGHRAMRYIKYMKINESDFQLNIAGIAICNFTLDWTRKWYQHERDIRINMIDLWEPKFMNYMLETQLGGTPKTVPEKYHEFSTYSFFDEENRNIELFKNYAIRAYIKPEIKYRLKKYLRTLYENNSTDMVGFLAELRLAGNTNTELIELKSEDNHTQTRNSQTTWNNINKKELFEWILKQCE